MPKTAGPDLSVSQTAVRIFGEESAATIKAVQRLIQRQALPGARKLDPSKRTSPYLIPEAAVDAFLAAEKKRSQSKED